MSTSASTGVSKPRRVHTKEFKQGALRLAEQIGVSRASTVLGIDSSQFTTVRLRNFFYDKDT